LEGSGPIDGELPENQMVISATLCGLIWNPGDRLVFRWLDTNDPGNDAGQGIGNFMFAPVPEPTTLLMCGTVLLGAGVYRQRRRFGWLQRS